MYDRKEHVVIIGGGFAGLACAKRLKKAHVEVTLIDSKNHHLFQPLLYQVATGALGPAEIAAPLRQLLRKQDNVRVLMQEVVGLDKAKKELKLGDGNIVAYDKLVIAAGSRYNYFGQDEALAPSLKNLEDAVEIRARILRAFEEAELNPARAHELLNFVIIGAGPTGVELAGQIAELARKGLKKNFKNIDPATARVLLLDMAPKVLGPMGDNLSQHGHRQLEELGVEVLLSGKVEHLDTDHVIFDGQRIPTKTVIWAAGVQAASIADILIKDMGAVAGPGGRIITDTNYLVKDEVDIYAIGDIAAMEDVFLPGLATVAMQGGRYVADHIMRKTDKPFEYKDKGSLATIGRNRAVGKVGRFEFHGFIAWMLWLLIHLRYLAGGQNRAVVLLRWIIGYLTFGRVGRLITGSWTPKA